VCGGVRNRADHADHIATVHDSQLDRARWNQLGRCLCGRRRGRWRHVQRQHPHRGRRRRRRHCSRHRVRGHSRCNGDRKDRTRRPGWQLLAGFTGRKLIVRGTCRCRRRLRWWVWARVRRPGRQCRWCALGPAPGIRGATDSRHSVERDEHHRVRRQRGQVVPTWRGRRRGVGRWRRRRRCNDERRRRNTTRCEQFQRRRGQRWRGTDQQLAHRIEPGLRVWWRWPGQSDSRSRRNERRDGERYQCCGWCGHRRSRRNRCGRRGRVPTGRWTLGRRRVRRRDRALLR
jgi:hypothetical protein